MRDDTTPPGYCSMCWHRWGVGHKAVVTPECATREGACVGKKPGHVNMPHGDKCTDEEYRAAQVEARKEYMSRPPPEPKKQKKK